MRSKAISPDADVDFERDVPITAEDIVALARARVLPAMSPQQYIDWVAYFEHQRPDDPLSHPFETPFEL